MIEIDVSVCVDFRATIAFIRDIKLHVFFANIGTSKITFFALLIRVLEIEYLFCNF